MAKKTVSVQQGAKVGLLSRLDYGSKGFRRGLIEEGFHICRNEHTNYNILGGLISGEDIRVRMEKFIAEEIRQDKMKGVVYANLDRFAKRLKEKHLLKNELLAARKDELREKFLARIARDLAEIIPVITEADPENPGNIRTIDLFIITSPKAALDGELGERVAHMLAELRSDIRVWNAGGDFFPVLYVDKSLWALTPSEQTMFMRADYYSTAAERVIKDKIKQTSRKGSPDLYVVFCFGSSINKPKGELKYAYVSVPVLSRIEKTKVNENQIGVKVLDFPADGSQYLVRNYNLKDMVSRELSYVVAPESCSDIQRQIIDVIKERGWATPGMLAYYIKNANKEKIAKEVRKLLSEPTFHKKGENWPGIIYRTSSHRYYFDLDFIQKKLRYPRQIIDNSFKEDRIMAFCCLHAGSIEADYGFFVNTFPELIIQSGAKILVNAGDTKEGLKHSLAQKGEVIPGMNSTKQEIFAAHLIGSVIYKVFVHRFESLCNNRRGAARLSVDKVDLFVQEALLLYTYILGNHDLWESEDGHDPLTVFHLTLINFLFDKIKAFLTEHGLRSDSLKEIVDGKVLSQQIFSLPSGLKVSVQHPFMARAKTTSLRPQEMLQYAQEFGCKVAIGGNFHVAEAVDEWHPDMGQCTVLQVGTIKHGSNFERRKMKIVDQGVAFLRILSRGGDIFMTETAFYGGSRPVGPEPIVDNLGIINAFIRSLGVDELK